MRIQISERGLCVGNILLNVLTGVPQGFPTEIETPGYFLQAVDSPFFLWFFRIGFAIILVSVLLYARSTPPAEPPAQQDVPGESQEESKGEA